MLLLKKSAAIYLFLASLVGVLIHNSGTAGTAIDNGLLMGLMYILMPFLVAGFFLWYATHVQRKGWIG